MSEEDPDRSVSGPGDEDELGAVITNGRPTSKTNDPRNRSASSTIHDRSTSGPNFSLPTRGTASPSSAHLSVGSALGGVPAFASPYGATPSSASAKESFLNYFFGGSEMSAIGGRSPLNDMGRGERSENPLAGRKGHEGSAAAFDMKSLDKHLEAVSHSLSLYHSNVIDDERYSHRIR